MWIIERFAKQIFETTEYPSDHADVNPAERFEGKLTMDVKGIAQKLEWRTESTATDRMTLGAHERKLFFLATWIHSPQDVTLPIEAVAPVTIFGGSRLIVNGAEIPGEASGDYGIPGRHIIAKQLPLRKGWNSIVLRCYWL